MYAPVSDEIARLTERLMAGAPKVEAPEGCNGKCMCGAPAYISLLFVECSRGDLCDRERVVR